MADLLTITIPDVTPISALLALPDDALACLVFAHGAGAGMSHAFMEAVATGLNARRVAVLRYNFPFMEAGSRRPDPPARAQATVRIVMDEAHQRMPCLPLFAGGKSFGGRMTSQAQAAEALPGVRGLVFFGFPLHPANKPSTTRAAHLRDVRVPMLFLQGTRDALADPALIAGEIEGLGNRACLHGIDGADHAFHVAKRSGRTDLEVLDAMLDRTASWMDRVANHP